MGELDVLYQIENTLYLPLLFWRAPTEWGMARDTPSSESAQKQRQHPTLPSRHSEISASVRHPSSFQRHHAYGGPGGLDTFWHVFLHVYIILGVLILLQVEYLLALLSAHLRIRGFQQVLPYEHLWEHANERLQQPQGGTFSFVFTSAVFHYCLMARWVCFNRFTLSSTWKFTPLYALITVSKSQRLPHLGPACSHIFETSVDVFECLVVHYLFSIEMKKQQSKFMPVISI